MLDCIGGFKEARSQRLERPMGIILRRVSGALQAIVIDMKGTGGGAVQEYHNQQRDLILLSQCLPSFCQPLQVIISSCNTDNMPKLVPFLNVNNFTSFCSISRCLDNSYAKSMVLTVRSLDQQQQPQLETWQKYSFSGPIQDILKHKLWKEWPGNFCFKNSPRDCEVC